jgi:exopolyphosphatase/pppGpp-phosphohydrolase
MKALNVTAVEVSPWALREGIILHYLQTRLNEPLVLPCAPPQGDRHGRQHRAVGRRPRVSP